MAEPYDLLLGRTTYEIFASSFAKSTSDNPTAEKLNNPRKYVVTSTLKQLQYEKTALSDLQGTWTFLRDTVVENGIAVILCDLASPICKIIRVDRHCRAYDSVNCQLIFAASSLGGNTNETATAAKTARANRQLSKTHQLAPRAANIRVSSTIL